MKKLFLILFICFFSLTAISCSAPANAGASTENISLPLLSGYPQDILPLYQPYKLLSCGFSTFSSDASVVGRQAFGVTYESMATQQDLYKYYSSLLTENNAQPSANNEAQEDEDAAASSVSGKIGSNGVEINFLDNAGNTVIVYLTIGLSKDKYTDANPFFSGYPNGLADEYGVQAKQESTYKEQYYGSKTIHYITVYSTGLTQQAFLDYYQKYTAKQGFSQTKSESGASVAWQDQGFSCSVVFAGGKSGYITIDLQKQA